MCIKNLVQYRFYVDLLSVRVRVSRVRLGLGFGLSYVSHPTLYYVILVILYYL